MDSCHDTCCNRHLKMIIINRKDKQLQRVLQTQVSGCLLEDSYGSLGHGHMPTQCVKTRSGSGEMLLGSNSQWGQSICGSPGQTQMERCTSLTGQTGKGRGGPSVHLRRDQNHKTPKGPTHRTITEQGAPNVTTRRKGTCRGTAIGRAPDLGVIDAVTTAKGKNQDPKKDCSNKIRP